MELLATVTIDKYVRKIKTAESRRATYYEEGEKLPKKYSNSMGTNYSWMFFAKKNKKFLVDRDGELVIKNPNVAGTSRYKLINGQELHQLTLKDYERSKILKALKEQMIKECNKLEPITKFPIRILCELHDTYYDYEHLKKDGKVNESIDWDIDNRGLFYCKTLPDVLCGSPSRTKNKEIEYLSKRIIPDDHRKFITQAPTPLFFPIENAEERKLVFKIYHDDREIIKNSEYYGNNS